jgi:hypothetical protein
MRLRSGVRCPAIAAAPLLTLVSVSQAQAQTLPYGGDTPNSASKAQTFLYGVDVGVAETDNVTLVSTNKVSQTIAVADADFDIKQQSRLLDVDAKGDFTDLNYLEGAYGNQVIGRFDGSAHLAIIPERLVWVVQDDFGQAALDPFTPSTPANLENINYLSTGPDMVLRFGASSYLNASVRYARAQFGTTPYNSNRVLGDLAWGYQLSAQSSVSLNGQAERVMFQNTALNSDFDRNSGFVQYEVKGARTEFLADLGATTISQSAGAISTISQSAGPISTIGQNVSLTTSYQNASSTSGGLAKLQLTRKLSAASQLTLSAGHYLTDASSSFSSPQGGALGTIGSAPAAQTGENYISNYASVGWTYQRNRTTIALSGRWERDTYLGQSQLDNTIGGAEFSVRRRLTHALTAEVLGRIYKTDYLHSIISSELGTSDYNAEMIGAALTWRHGHGLEVKMRYEHSAEVTTGIYGYGENRIMLTVGYRPMDPKLENDPGALSPGTE